MPPSSGVRLLRGPNVAYIKSQIEDTQPSRVKVALQSLCKLYRQGYRIPGDGLLPVEQSVVGALYVHSDEKVQRWALNTLARIGRRQHSLPAVTDTLRKVCHDPQLAAAAVAAIFNLCNGEAPSIISGFDVLRPRTVTLAALQHADPTTLDLAEIPVDIETATPDDLKLALVVVGLDRAPLNLFHPRHSNAEIVKALGAHHDPIVAQYSVWAVAESAHLGFSDLGIDIRSIEAKPPNVRGWMYQLIALRAETAAAHFELIQLGIKDPVAEARAGLALGMRDTFIEGLERLAVDWALTETDTDTRNLVLDHLVRQSDRCASYEELAAQLYEAAQPGSEARRRFLFNAERKPLYRRLRLIDIAGGHDDLFGRDNRGDINLTNITIGNLQGGAVAIGGGDAKNDGTSSNVYYDATTITKIQTELSKAERELHASQIDEAVKKQGLEDVRNAQTEPTPSNLHKVVSMIERIGRVAGVASGLIEIGGLIAKLAGLG